MKHRSLLELASIHSRILVRRLERDAKRIRAQKQKAEADRIAGFKRLITTPPGQGFRHVASYPAGYATNPAFHEQMVQQAYQQRMKQLEEQMQVVTGIDPFTTPLVSEDERKAQAQVRFQRQMDQLTALSGNPYLQSYLAKVTADVKNVVD